MRLKTGSIILLTAACGLDTYGHEGNDAAPSSSGSSGPMISEHTGEPSGSSDEPTTTGPTASSGEDLSSTGETTAMCGNAVAEAPEECDDGNSYAGDSCTNACTLPVCGDGILGPGEACDDGDLDETDECTTECKAPTCGNGLTQGIEECDAGGESAECNENCTLARCGDFTVNATAGESCDEGGDTNGCDLDCTMPTCGDLHTNASADEQCDDGNTVAGDTCSPTCHPTTLSSVGVGREHVCVLFAEGNVRCWGKASYGRLGDGDGANNVGDEPGEMPAADIALPGKVVSLGMGAYHTCAVFEQGKVRCWGYNSKGQLGYGDTQPRGDKDNPIPAEPLDLGGEAAVQVSGGSEHTCALMADKHVRCWGLYGEVGFAPIGQENIGDEPGEMPPTPVIGIEGAIQISAGSYHTCALLENGKVHCWGHNEDGRLGIGSSEHVYFPVKATELPSDDVQQIASGRVHTCALFKSGSVQCWGQGGDGQLGTNDFNAIGDQPGEMPLPEYVNFGGVAKQLVAGSFHTCVLLATNAVKCWGYNKDGRLGYGFSGEDIGDGPGELPILIEDGINLGGATIAQLDAHLGGVTCVRYFDNTLRCWGWNGEGQLGLGDTNNVGDDETPESVGTVPF